MKKLRYIILCLILFQATLFAQKAPKPFMFNFDENINSLDTDIKAKLKVQLDSTMEILKIHQLKYSMVNVCHYDSFSIANEKINNIRYHEIKKYLILIGVKKKKIIRKENNFIEYPSLQYNGKGWKVQFIL